MFDIVKRRRGETDGGSLSRARDEVNDLFGRFFNLGWPWEGAQAGAWWPSMDIADTGDSLVAKADLPGMKAEDIDIAVQGNTLTISGERKDVREEKDGNYYHYERRNGTFQREITLPSEVQADKIDAQYRDGVLTVTMPKSEQAKTKRIQVKS